MIVTGVTALVLAACQTEDETTREPEPEKGYVLADLALSVPAPQAATRMGDTEVQATGNFRGISKLTLIPFSARGTVGADDRPAYYEGMTSYVDRTTPTLKTDFDERFRYYDRVMLMQGVASFLVYGQAQPTAAAGTVQAKAVNGSLLTKVGGRTVSGFPDRVAVPPSAISFELEPMYDRTEGGGLAVPTEAKTIATALTAIANVQVRVGGETVAWKDTSDGWLQTLYRNFTNQDAGAGSVIAGSTASVSAYLAMLKTRLQGHEFDNEPERSLRTAIIEAIDAAGLGGTDYPGCYGLPDGAAALRWDESLRQYVVPTTTTSVAPINTLSRFAFPPELYYYGNSRIKASNDEVSYTSYQGRGDWSNVLTLYPYDDAVVSNNTRAVAIKSPLQYGVARMSATVRLISSAQNAVTGNYYLPDADGQLVEVGATAFPVTGIIVSGQCPVDFEWKSTGTDNGGIERFVYDGHFTDTNASPPLPRAYLSHTASAALSTLLLQSMDGENVKLILELENNSAKDFAGENGTIYRGTKFYLVGEVDLSTGTSTESGDFLARVFTQDHTTTVALEVKTLAHAYNVLPNILAGRLDIGVDVRMDWVQATPTTVIITED